MCLLYVFTIISVKVGNKRYFLPIFAKINLYFNEKTLISVFCVFGILVCIMQ